MPSHSHEHKPPPAAILVVPLIVALALTLFAWPASRLEPRDLPVGVAGPQVAAQAIEDRLSSQDGAFETHRYTDEAAARQAIEDREIYGAFVATATGAKVLTASGASANVAQLLQQAASGGHTGGAGRPAPEVEDVVPGSADDPRGTGLASSVLPLVLAGILVGLLTIFITPSFGRRAVSVVVGSVLSGFAAIVVAQWWLGVVEHNWLANWAVLSLIVLSIAIVVAGLHALLGTPGIALGALTMVLIGNPFSGISSAPEMLPQPVGLIGQLMPPGAGGNLLRSTAFFDGADAGGHLAVLFAWVMVGLIALGAAVVRERRSAPQRASRRPEAAGVPVG
jgi:hypothetical protein